MSRFKFSLALFKLSDVPTDPHNSTDLTILITDRHLRHRAPHDLSVVYSLFGITLHPLACRHNDLLVIKRLLCKLCIEQIKVTLPYRIIRIIKTKPTSICFINHNEFVLSILKENIVINILNKLTQQITIFGNDLSHLRLSLKFP